MGIFRQFPYSNFHEMNMDEIIKIVKTMSEEWEETKAEWASYKDYIDNYFDTLDLSEETYNAIMRMIDEGVFNEVVDPTIINATSEWLAEHITQPVGVVIDNSLTVRGACADAKATGDALKYKVNQPVDENNQPIYGTDGQSLRTKGDGTTEWADVGLPTDAQTAQAVSDWLDNHPEATTTVADGSLTEAKFTNALKLKTIKEYVTPEMFGAVGDGVADDTLAVTSAIESGKSVLFSASYYIASTITIDRDINMFGDGNIVATGDVFELRPNRHYSISGISFSGDGTGTAIKCVRIHDESIIFDVKIDNFATGIECVACWVSNYNNLLITNCTKGVLFNEGANIVNFANSAIFNCDTGIEVYQGENYAGQTSGLNITGCVFEYEQKVLNLKTSSYGTISGVVFANNYIESCANGITSEADSESGRLRAINVVRNTMYFSNQESYNDYYIDLSAMLSVNCNITGNLCKNANIKLVKFKSDARGYNIQGNDLQNATFDALGQYGYVENNGALYGSLDINNTLLSNVVLKGSNNLPSTPTPGKLVFTNGKIYKGDGYQFGMPWAIEDIYAYDGTASGDTAICSVTLKSRTNMLVNICLANVTSNVTIRLEYIHKGATYDIVETVSLNADNISRVYSVNGNIVAVSVDGTCDYDVVLFPLGS